MRFSQGIKDEHHFTEDAPDSVFTTYSQHPTSISPMPKRLFMRIKKFF